MHSFVNSNRYNKVYMATANLPVHYKIINTGVSTGASMLQICSAVQMEGGTLPIGLSFSSSTPLATVPVTTKRPILSIRSKTRFNGLENRARLVPRHYGAASENTKSAYCEIVHEGTLGGASFQSFNADSQAEVDTSATTITGGHVIDSFYVASSGGGVVEELAEFKEIMSIGFNGDTPDNLSIVCTSLSTSANIFAHIEWEEFR